MSRALSARGMAIAGVVALALAACDRAPQAEGGTKPVASSSQPTPATSTAPTAMPPARNGEFVLPGAFASDSTVADLEQRFGKTHVRVGELPGAEGEVHRGVELFADDPSRQAYVYFQDEQKLHGLSLVAIHNDGSRWTLDNGVGIGMSLTDLIALNGAPIVFTGFDWDYGGYVSDWSDGKLAASEGGAVRRSVRLRARSGDGSVARPAYPMGDSQFRSDDAAYPKLGELAEVGYISVSFPGEDDL